jgi:hypothetical protein
MGVSLRMYNFFQRLIRLKPNLRLKPNHFKHKKRIIRRWDSKHLGQAFSDGHGWYTTENGFVRKEII